MICNVCGKEMTVIHLEMSEDLTKCRQEFACTNRKCGNYCGNDLNNPCKSVKGEYFNV